MSVAALDALALRRQLDHDGEPAPNQFFQEIARAIDAPWAIAAGPEHLLRPQMVLRVVRGTLRRRPAQGRLEPVGRPDLTAPGTGRQR
jgi:hypothetical protein